jgi:Bacterial Ig domain/WD40-like Beta Propeller Repeat
MTKALGALACAVALWAVAVPSAAAAPVNGQLAAAAGDRLVSLNPDGSGLRTLWTAPAGTAVARPAWSPDGNRIAFAAGGRIGVYGLAAGTAQLLTSGTQDADPAWTPDGRIAFRRGAVLMSIRPDGTDPQLLGLSLAAGTVRVSFAPDGARVAYVLGSELHVLALSGLDDRLLSRGARGAPAWSPDSSRIAFSSATAQIVALTPPEPATTPLSPPGGVDSAPAWSPDAGQVVYAREQPVAELRIGSRTVLAGALGDPAWQPCTPGVSVACASVAAPSCAAPASATTPSGQPVDLPPPACTDPAGRALSVRVVEGPAHGTLSGARYTPATGFTGQDVVGYRASNGVLDSNLVRQAVFVVPRNLGAVLVPQPVVRAPFLNARALPRLDRRGRTTLRAGCDRDCRVSLRLTARAGRTFTSKTVKRSLTAGRVVTLKFTLRHRPRRRVKIAWIVGTVTGAGHRRTVRLPVRLPR